MTLSREEGTVAVSDENRFGSSRCAKKRLGVSDGEPLRFLAGGEETIRFSALRPQLVQQITGGSRRAHTQSFG